MKPDENDATQFLNYIGSTASDGVNDVKLRWCDALSSLSSSKKAVQDVEVRGNVLKHLDKQALTSSHVV